MVRLCRFDEIAEGQARGFKVDDSATQATLIAIKKQGQLYLYRNNCPHRGIGLEWQPDTFLDADGQFIQCSTHGALFLIETGVCIQGPCQGSSLQAVEYQLEGEEVVLSEESLSRSAPAIVSPN